MHQMEKEMEEKGICVLQCMSCDVWVLRFILYRGINGFHLSLKYFGYVDYVSGSRCRSLWAMPAMKIQIGSRWSWSRNYAAKDIRFGVEARALMLKGVEEFADSVKGNVGPKCIEFVWH